MPKTTPSKKLAKSYVQLFKEYPNPYNLSVQEFRLILKVFNSLFVLDMVNEGSIYTLPKGTGTLSVRKKVTYGKGFFDYEYYKHTGEKVWKKNPHSSGLSASFK